MLQTALCPPLVGWAVNIGYHVASSNLFRRGRRPRRNKGDKTVIIGLSHEPFEFHCLLLQLIRLPVSAIRIIQPLFKYHDSTGPFS